MRRSTEPATALGRRVPALCLLAVASLCIGGASAPRGGAHATLTKVRETRKVKLAAYKGDDSFDFNKPGLELTFSIEAPRGKQIVRLDQPTSIVSTDSTGRNLADVKPNFRNRKEYVKLVHLWQKPAEEFTLTLAPPQRAATRFSVAARFDAWAFAELKESLFTPEPGGGPTGVDDKLFGGTKVTAELTESGGKANLIVIPGTVKPYIAEIEIIDGKTTHQSNSSMWNDAAVTYRFNTPLKPSMKVRLKVRMGLGKFACVVDIKDQPLP